MNEEQCVETVTWKGHNGLSDSSVRCEKPLGHAGIHYGPTLLGGTAWPDPDLVRPR